MELVTMSDYIYATPNKVLENVNNAKAITKPMVDLYLKKEYKQIIFVASGSSYTAIHCARGYICQLLKTDVKVINPYTFAEYDYKYVNDDDFVIIVSQSGASTNCISALESLKKINHERIVLTGNVNSDCKDYADVMIDWNCGIETMGYVTLGVVTLVEYLMLFAAYASKEDVVSYTENQIKKAMENHKEVCALTEEFIKKHYHSLMRLDRVYVLGVGSNYGTALEGALKIGETIKVLSVAYEQDEFLHGPALQLNPKYTMFVIDNSDYTSAHAKQVFDALQKVTDNTFMITSSNHEHSNILNVNNKCDEPFTCLYYLPFFELIAERISTDLNSKKSHPLYYEMNKVIDFRTSEFRKAHKADED